MATTDDDCPRCGLRLEESPAADASVECNRCGFYVYEHAEVDLPPMWREEPQLADQLGLSRLFAHLDGPGFIGVKGDTVELVRADLKAGEEADPEEYDIIDRDERAERIEQLAQTYNDEYSENGEDSARNVGGGN
ncbi:Zn finger [Haloarcula tailed virus 3]|uniref:Zn finger n=1 Tax=Haloarcula tailed virus 3 TaxID=2877990 RepID=A0AAE9BYX2_9CAUD|nr:Zn finger [Haloarcula tailed virus 3]UBF23394.1 Zn finger [Haloarcula tailed virus 3]